MINSTKVVLCPHLQTANSVSTSPVWRKSVPTVSPDWNLCLKYLEKNWLSLWKHPKGARLSSWKNVSLKLRREGWELKGFIVSLDPKNSSTVSRCSLKRVNSIITYYVKIFWENNNCYDLVWNYCFKTEDDEWCRMVRADETSINIYYVKHEAY